MLADDHGGCTGHVHETAQVQPYHVQPFQVQALNLYGNPGQLSALLGRMPACAVLRLTMVPPAINSGRHETVYDPPDQQPDQAPSALQLLPGSHVAGLLGTADNLPGHGQSIPVQHAESSGFPAWDTSQMVRQSPGDHHLRDGTLARSHASSYTAGESCREASMQPITGPGSLTPEDGPDWKFLDWLDEVVLENTLPSVASAAPSS